jgi:alanine racemase
MPHAWIEVDLEAIRLNLLALRSKLKPWVDVIAMVKGDAYGHGMVPVARTLVDAGVSRLGVAFVAEALQLRQAGITAPIVLVGSFSRNECDDLVTHDVTPAIADLELARELGHAAKRRGRRMPVHVDVDTGMGRLGARWEKVPQLVESLRAIDGLWIEGIFTHLSSADEDDQTYSRLQMRRFASTLERLRERGIVIPFVHAQNSAGILNLPEVSLQAVRPGLSLYGIYPSAACAKKALLRPALSFLSRVVLVKQVPGDTFVSYNRTYKTGGETNLATISVGYADGLPRLLSSKGHVLIRGRAYPIAGRVTMDHIVVDLGADDDVRAGDRVTLIGRDGGEEITVDQVAQWAGTISYEITTGLTARPARIYRGETAAPAEDDTLPRVAAGRRR